MIVLILAQFLAALYNPDILADDSEDANLNDSLLITKTPMGNTLETIEEDD